MLRTLKVLKNFAHYISSLEFGHVRKLLASWFKISILQMTLYLMWRRGVSPKLFSPFGVWTKIEKYLSEFLIQTNWVYPHYYDFSKTVGLTQQTLWGLMNASAIVTRAVSIQGDSVNQNCCPFNKTFQQFSKIFLLFLSF